MRNEDGTVTLWAKTDGDAWIGIYEYLELVSHGRHRNLCLLYPAEARLLYGPMTPGKVYKITARMEVEER